MCKNLTMVYFSLNKKEASPEVTHEKYREEGEFGMSRRDREEAKRTKATDNSKRSLKANPARI